MTPQTQQIDAMAVIDALAMEIAALAKRVAIAEAQVVRPAETPKESK